MPKGDKPVSLRVRKDGLRLNPGKNSVPVEILVDGDPYQTVWTTWNFEFWESVPVLLRDVRAGEDITQDMVEYRRLSSKEAGTGPVLERASLHFTRALRGLEKGAVLHKTDVGSKRARAPRRHDHPRSEKGLRASTRRRRRERRRTPRRPHPRRHPKNPSANCRAIVVDRELVQIDMTQGR